MSALYCVGNYGVQNYKLLLPALSSVLVHHFETGLTIDRYCLKEMIPRFGGHVKSFGTGSGLYISYVRRLWRSEKPYTSVDKSPLRFFSIGFKKVSRYISAISCQDTLKFTQYLAVKSKAV